MKTIIKPALTLAMIFCAFSLSAQPQQRQGMRTNLDPAARAKAQTEQMSKDVSLTPEQAEKVEALYLERFQKMQSQRQQMQQGQQRQQGDRQRMMGQDTAFNRKLSEILTKEQAVKWAEIQESKRSEREQNMQNMQGNRRQQQNAE